MNSFGELLKQYRTTREYRQTFVANKVGVTQGSYSKWENNLLVPGLKQGLDVIEFLEIPMRKVTQALKLITWDGESN